MTNPLDEYPLRWSERLLHDVVKTLAKIYLRSDDIETVVRYAGLDVTKINLDGDAATVWRGTLNEAARSDLVRELLQYVTDENPRLSHVVEAWFLVPELLEADDDSERTRVINGVAQTLAEHVRGDDMPSLVEDAGITSLRDYSPDAIGWAELIADAQDQRRLVTLVVAAIRRCEGTRLLDYIRRGGAGSGATPEHSKQTAWYPDDLPKLKTKFFGNRLATPIIDRGGLLESLNQVVLGHLSCLVVSGRDVGRRHSFELSKFFISSPGLTMTVVRINKKIAPSAHDLMDAIAARLDFTVEAEQVVEQSTASARKLTGELRRALKDRPEQGVIILFLEQPEELEPDAYELIEDLIAEFGDRNMNPSFSLIVIGLPQAPRFDSYSFDCQKLTAIHTEHLETFFSTVAQQVDKPLAPVRLAALVADVGAFLPDMSRVKEETVESCRKEFAGP